MASFDVVIVGAGIAGGLLARQLRLTYPELSLLVLDARTAMDDLKVGESTVEVATSYMVRRLNLGTYLYQHQLPKNGLRFFFDNEEKNLPITEMSEIGSDHMPFHPSFQLERAKLEADLVLMNRASGASVELGAKVLDLTIEPQGEHQVLYEKGGEKHQVSCRFLCDASGRRQLICRKLGLVVQKETRLNTGAAWGRYRNVAGLDAITDKPFRERVRYTSRHLSTNHMMYDGYWIWFIPLSGDLMSVGVVFDKDRVAGPRNRQEFEAFLGQHRSSKELMAGAVFEDFQAYAHLPYHTDLFFSKDRWALTGEAGAFVDPFYSPGSDFIATANELITSMIGMELGSADASEKDARIDTYNAFYKFKYESTLALYAGLYPVFGSYEVFRLKYLLDFHNYYNLVAWPFMADKLTDLAWLRAELDFAPRVLRILSQMASHFGKMAEFLRGRGEYFAQNQGRWANGLCGVAQFEQRLGPELDEGFRRAEVARAFGNVYAAILERVLDVKDLSNRARLLADLGFGEVLHFRDMDSAVLDRLLVRLGDTLAKEVRREMPQLAGLKVSFDRVPQAPLALRLSGIDADHPDFAQALARVESLWSQQGESLTHIAM